MELSDTVCLGPKTRGLIYRYQIPQGNIGPVERKLVELGEVRGVVSGGFVAELARCRVAKASRGIPVARVHCWAVFLALTYTCGSRNVPG